MLRTLVFLSIVLSLLGALNLWLYVRLVRDVTVERRWRRRGALTLLGLTLLTFSGAILAATREGALVDAIARAGWIWMGVMGLLAALLVVTEVPRQAFLLTARLRATPEAPGGIDPARRLFLARSMAGGVTAAAGGLASYGVFRAYAEPEISHVALKLRGLPKSLDGFSIVQVSDIHIGPLLKRPFLDEMVRRCNALKPDLMAITGDLVDGRVDELAPIVAGLQALQSRSGTYFITGNHEYFSGDVPWCNALSGLGLNVLRNRRVTIGSGKDSFELVGVDDWSGGRERDRGGYDLGHALEGWNPDRPTVLLAHQPKGFEDAAARGVGLQLSGHTHAGQQWPMTMVIPLIWTHPAGLWTQGDSHLYVSRGTGFWGPPMRIGAPPEIVHVTLLAS